MHFFKVNSKWINCLVNLSLGWILSNTPLSSFSVVQDQKFFCTPSTTFFCHIPFPVYNVLIFIILSSFKNGIFSLSSFSHQNKIQWLLYDALFLFQNIGYKTFYGHSKNIQLFVLTLTIRSLHDVEFEVPVIGQRLKVCKWR